MSKNSMILFHVNQIASIKHHSKMYSQGLYSLLISAICANTSQCLYYKSKQSAVAPKAKGKSGRLAPGGAH